MGPFACGLARLVLVSALLASASCSGGGGSGNAPVKHFPEGVAQKGPLELGTQLTIQVVNELLEPTGLSYVVQTEDDYGTFSLSQAVEADFIEIFGDGSFFDEIQGSPSASPVNLHALCDLQDDDVCNLNLVTTITANRIRRLVSVDGLPFDDARDQATGEFFSVFGISGISGSPDDFEITGAGEQGAALLAASLVLLQNSHVEDDFGVPIDDLVTACSTSLLNTGSFSVPYALEANITLPTTSVRSNLESFYAGQVIPPFEDFLDTDGDGVLNASDTPPIEPVAILSATQAECFGARLMVVGTALAASSICYPPVAGGHVGRIQLFGQDGSALGTIDNPSPVASDRFGIELAPGPLPNTIAAATQHGRVDVVTLEGGLVYSASNATTDLPQIATDGTALLVGWANETSGGMTQAGRIDVIGPSGALDHSLEMPSPLQNERLGLYIATHGGRLAATVAWGDPEQRVVVFDIATGAIEATIPAQTGWTYFGTGLHPVGDLLAIPARTTPSQVNDCGAVALYDWSGTLVANFESPQIGGCGNFGAKVARCGSRLLVSAAADSWGYGGSGLLRVYDVADWSFLEQILAPDAVAHPQFTTSLVEFGGGFAASSVDEVYLFDCP